MPICQFICKQINSTRPLEISSHFFRKEEIRDLWDRLKNHYRLRRIPVESLIHAIASFFGFKRKKEEEEKRREEKKKVGSRKERVGNLIGGGWL